MDRDDYPVHSLLGRFVPYLGGSIGAVYNDRDFTGVIGPNTGLKVFVDDHTFLNLGYRYEYFFSRFKDIDNNTNRGNHIANIGIGFVWGGNRTAGKPSTNGKTARLGREHE